MWLEIIKLIREIILGEKAKLLEQQEKLAGFFGEISELLKSTADSLHGDMYPHGSCAAMSLLSNNLINCLQEKVENDRLIQLAKLMDEASILEKEWVERKNPDTIKRLEQIAGEFKALGMLFNLGN